MTEVRPLEVTGPGSITLVGFDPTLDISWTADLPIHSGTYQDAVAVPLSRSPQGGYEGGLLDSNSQLIADSQRAKSNRAWRMRPGGRGRDLEGIERLPGRTLFIGYHLGIFGHVLLEMLPRLWPADTSYDTYDTLLCYPTRLGRTRPTLALEAYVQTLLGALGIRQTSARIVARNKPLRLDEVFVASPGFWLKRGYHPRVAEPFDRIGNTFEKIAGPDQGERPRRIYLSRSHLGKGQRRASNETEIEDLMTARGFTVVHPQELPIQEQVVLVRRAEVIAGCDGSALHLAAFSRPGTRLVGLDSRFVLNQFMIDEFSRLQAVHALATKDRLDDRSDTWFADLDTVHTALDLAI